MFARPFRAANEVRAMDNRLKETTPENGHAPHSIHFVEKQRRKRPAPSCAGWHATNEPRAQARRPKTYPAKKTLRSRGGLVSQEHKPIRAPGASTESKAYTPKKTLRSRGGLVLRARWVSRSRGRTLLAYARETNGNCINLRSRGNCSPRTGRRPTPPPIQRPAQPQAQPPDHRRPHPADPRHPSHPVARRALRARSPR